MLETTNSLLLFEPNPEDEADIRLAEDDLRDRRSVSASSGKIFWRPALPRVSRILILLAFSRCSSEGAAT